MVQSPFHKPVIKVSICCASRHGNIPILVRRICKELHAACMRNAVVHDVAPLATPLLVLRARAGTPSDYVGASPSPIFRQCSRVCCMLLQPLQCEHTLQSAQRRSTPMCQQILHGCAAIMRAQSPRLRFLFSAYACCILSLHLLDASLWSTMGSG